MLFGPRRYRRYSVGRLFLVVFLVWTVVDFLQLCWYGTRPTTDVLPDPAEKPRVFISSIHWNSEAVLRSNWNAAVIELAKYLGAANIYVSIYGSGSWDNTHGALDDLRQQLDAIGVNHQIVVKKTTHADEIAKAPGPTGWIVTPDAQTHLRRVPYISSLRNYSLQPLLDLGQNGTTFDRVLFLNDVVFQLADVINLLATNQGHYAAACSLDFQHPPQFYDRFALRDFAGHEAVMPTWPYFRSSTSRAALKQRRPVPVRSCWNGMVVMDALPLYREQQPLIFRGIADSLAQLHLEGSECCLIHNDNPLSQHKGVWLNPEVLVGYSPVAYQRMNEQNESIFWYLRKAWENRLRRWFTTDWFKRRKVNKRVDKWVQSDSKRSESAAHCLINEMQFLDWNGWEHV